MGVQQYTHQRRRWVEGSFYNTYEVIWIHSSILWTNKLASYFLDNNKWYSKEPNWYRGHVFRQWCVNKYGRRGRAQQSSGRDTKENIGKWSLYKTRKVHAKVKESELPRSRVGTGRGENRERKGKISSRLANTMMCKRFFWNSWA